jgi:hypothetical protein
MTTSTTETEPARRPRRRAAAVVAALLLLVGVGLLLYSYASWRVLPGHTNANVSPTTSLSPMAQTRTLPAASPAPSAGATSGPPVVVVITTHVAVPSFFTEPASSPQDSGLLALVTTVSGLLASVAGIVSAVVSVRGNRPR